jgi:hypothetical protein
MLLEVIAPALIMLMLGSQFFFLLEILYRGNYELPIHWVFGLYVFAIVLISRISIMEGLERAHVFSIALLAAVFLQTGFGPHWVLVLFTWWAASKLTWDCTFIDQTRDVTGQGLLSASLDRWSKWGRNMRRMFQGKWTLAEALRSEPEPQPVQAALAEDSEEHPSVAHWMKDFVLRRKRKNTPGIWAFQFFVLGLGLFAIGQLFVDTSERARQYGIKMFAIYLFAGLGLMMFVSLVGLFRYLRQRGAEMPNSIAGAWLVAGTGIAAILVGIVLLFPWPNTGFSLSSLVPDLRTARRVGDRTPLKEQGKVDGPNPGRPAEKRGAPGETGEATNQQASRGRPGGDKAGGQPQGKPGSESGGQAGGGQGEKPSSGDQSSSSSSQPNQPPQSGRSKPSQPSSQSQPNASSKPPDARANSNQPSQSPANRPGEAASKKSGDDAASASSSGQRTEQANDQKKSGSAGSKSQPAESGGAPRPEKSDSARDQESASQAKPAPPASQPSPQESRLGNVWKSISGMVSTLFWLAAIVAAGVLGFIYRQRIVSGLIALFTSLSEFFFRLFGGKPAAESPEAIANATRGEVDVKPFSSYHNPFLDPRAAQHTPDELVRYTFAAFEALARDAGVPRHPDETPLEFSRRVAERFRPLQSVAGPLAQLFSLVAYAPGKISAIDAQPLRAYWTQLQNFAESNSPAPALSV